MLGRATAEQQRNTQFPGHVLFSRIDLSGRTSPKATRSVNFNALDFENGLGWISLSAY
jgi:hypothetical protein